MRSSYSPGSAGVADPHKFLEDVLSKESLSWVDTQNTACLSALGDPTKTQDYERILTALDSKDKIPHLSQMGVDGDGGDEYYYNFWQDDTHVQGIWRRTSLESYKSENPQWTTVLDLDALAPPNTDTASTWVWHGSTPLHEKGPQGLTKRPDRALIALSPGGSDADITREINLETEKFLSAEEGGFELLTPAKTSASYRTRDELLIGTEFEGEEDTMTDSGYPRVIKSWKRGTPLSSATTIYEGLKSDIAAAQYAYEDRGYKHEFRMRQVTFYTSHYEYRSLNKLDTSETALDVKEEFRRVPIPEDAEIGMFGGDALLTLRSEWCPPGTSTTFPSGSMLVHPISRVMEDDWEGTKVLFQPTDSISLQSTTTTKDYLVLSVLDNVRTRLVIWRRDSSGWTELNSTEDAVPVGEDVDISCTNRDDSVTNSVFITRSGFLTPDTLEYLPDVSHILEKDKSSNIEKLKSNPSMFQSSNLLVEQHVATSLDGTPIRYFLIRRSNDDGFNFNGKNPTLLDAYGGFEISMLPYYSASVGRAWLESGGVKVIANIRGGGEYGPSWHQSALKSNRNKCFEDMEAVAQDLIARKITCQEKLACIGGSNGGLLVGNLLTRPLSSKLFGAAVCQVPLLDMKVYSRLLAGASWMAEYGDPDKEEEWSFLRKFSPYHVLRHDILNEPEEAAPLSLDEAAQPDWKCPKVLFTTSTRDDRVHPGHARKMVRALIEEAQPRGLADTVYYWENVEGGHGGAADNKQRAKMWALTYSFLKQTLGLEGN